MRPLFRKLLYSLPALLAGPGAVLLLLLIEPALPAFGAVFIMLAVSAAAMLSVWASDTWQVPARSYRRRVRYLRMWLAYGTSYVVLIVTQSALLITLAWLSLFVSDAGGAHGATVVAMWFIAGISAAIVAVHLVRAIDPTVDLKEYLWVSLAAVAVLAAADLGLPAAVRAADTTVLGAHNLMDLAEYATLAASLWLVITAHRPAGGAEADDGHTAFASPQREAPASALDGAPDAERTVHISPAVLVPGDVEVKAGATMSG